MKLAEKIVLLRKQKGLSQEELAEWLNVSRQTISRWELGTALPDATNIVQLSKLFEVSADYLLNEEYHSDQDIPAVKHHKDFLMIFALQIMCFVFHLITCVYMNGFFAFQIISLVLNLFFAKKTYEELQNYDILSELVKKYYIDIYVILIWFTYYISIRGWRPIIDELLFSSGILDILYALEIENYLMWTYTLILLLFIPIIKFTIKKINGGN